MNIDEEQMIWAQDEHDRIARVSHQIDLLEHQGNLRAIEDHFCDGLCDPMCASCNALADEAANNRNIEQGY